MIEACAVVPTFNEVAKVAELVSRGSLRPHAVRWEIIFVGDDSTDLTAAEARELAKADPPVRCLQCIGCRGLSKGDLQPDRSPDIRMQASGADVLR